MLLLLSLNINITNSTFTTSSYKHWQSTQHVKKMSPKPTLFHCNGTYVLPEVAMLLQMFFFMVLQYFQLLMSYQIP